MASLVQVLLGGLADGCVYALIALGMSLVYSVSRIIDLAQGGFVVLAALVAVSAEQRFGLGPAVVVPLVVVAFAGLLALIDRVVMMPAVRRADRERMLLITVGVLQTIGGLVLLVWGNLPYTMRPFTAGPPLVVGGVRVMTQYLWIAGALAVAVTGLWFVLTRTDLGLTLRATAVNPRAAALSGVRVDRVRLLAFSLSGAMAGLAGCAIIPITFFQFSTVTPYAVAGFVAAVVGGLGSSAGAVLGGLVLGLLQGLFSRYTHADLAQVAAMSVLIFLLLVRPSGLLGRAAEVRR